MILVCIRLALRGSDAWIDRKNKDRTIERYFDYWVRGRNEYAKKEPRWSIIRNVLGWVD